MCEDNKRFKLCIPNEDLLSEFVIGLIKEEAEAINNNIEIEDGQIKIETAYINELDDKIEVSFYIINNINQKINFDKLPICLTKNDTIVGYQIFESKELGDISPKSIKYSTLYFDKENVQTYDFSNVEVGFNASLKFNAKNTVRVDLANLPSTINKKDLKTIDHYLNELPYLSVNTIDINTFSGFYDEFKNLSIIIVIRNGYKTDVKLAALPIKVYDYYDKLVYSGVFTPDDINIKADTAVIQHVIVKEENVLVKNGDLSKIRVEFK